MSISASLSPVAGRRASDRGPADWNASWHAQVEISGELYATVSATKPKMAEGRRHAQLTTYAAAASPAPLTRITRGTRQILAGPKLAEWVERGHQGHSAFSPLPASDRGSSRWLKKQNVPRMSPFRVVFFPGFCRHLPLSSQDEYRFQLLQTVPPLRPAGTARRVRYPHVHASGHRFR